MSTYGGPNIVKDGLVLHLDVANNKSFRGEPTINASNTGNIYTNWNNSGTATWVNNDTSIDKFFTDIQINSMTQTTDGNSHIGIGYGLINSSTWTASVYVYIPSSAGIMNGSAPYFRSFPANITRGTLTYNGEANWNNWPRDKWIRIETTWDNIANDTYMYISCYTNTTGNKIYFTAPQLENKPYSTPFVNGTRGTSVATGGGWIDRSGNGNNGELLNGVTYSQDFLGSLVFDGTNDYVGFGNILNMSTISFSLCAWVKSSSVAVGNNNGIFYKRGTAYPYSEGYRLNMPNGAFNLHIADGTNYESLTTTTTTYNDNNWHYVVAVVNRTNKLQIYVDSELKNEVNSSLSTSINSTVPLSIGTLSTGGATYHPFSGNISLPKIYNIPLTSSEIEQNFNATKGRFGL